MKQLLDNLITVVTLAAGTLQFQFGGRDWVRHDTVVLRGGCAAPNPRKNGWMPEQARLVGMSVH